MINLDIKKEEYFFDPINSIDNERIVELRLALNYYEYLYNNNRLSNILEIGNVLGFYGHIEHECIDKFADLPDISPAGEVKNIDAIEYNYAGRDVISISTIEHIGMSDYNNPTPNDGEDAIKALEKIEKESDNFFITFGPNHNKTLDKYVIENINRFNWHGWCRKDLNEWEYTNQDMTVWEKEFDKPFKFANGIILLLNKG